ncbi:MAG: hypothetical protein ABID04_02675 [Patescibacteria group bacterium]
MLKTTVKLNFVFVLILLIVPPKAHAYLDPGSGSYLIQILIASLAGTGYILKLNWQKIKDFFSKKKTKKTEDEKADK